MFQQKSLTLLVPIWALMWGLFLVEGTYYGHHIYNSHVISHRMPSHPAPRQYGSMDNQLPPEPHAPAAVPEVSGGTDISGLPEVSGTPDMQQLVNVSRVYFGIMFDAGSTGTRIHIYKFIQKDPGECRCSKTRFLMFYLAAAS